MNNKEMNKELLKTRSIISFSKSNIFGEFLNKTYSFLSVDRIDKDKNRYVIDAIILNPLLYNNSFFEVIKQIVTNIFYNRNIAVELRLIGATNIQVRNRK